MSLTGTLGELALAAVLFVVSHFTLSSTGLRAAIAQRTGEMGFLGLYSLIAIVLLVWEVAAYAAAPHVVLWQAPGWVNWIVAAIVLVAAVLLVAGYTTPNPSAVMIREAALDQPPQGIIRVTRHPVMWGIGLWALAHMLVNGDAASLILFGSLAVLALGGVALIERKMRATQGGRWQAMARHTSAIPFGAIAAGRSSVSAAEIGWLRILGGVILFIILVFGHQPLFGPSPLPGLSP